LGRVVSIEASLMLIPLFVSLLYNESVLPFVATILIAAVISWLLLRFKPDNRELYATEGFVIVSLAWIVMSAIGALPFMFSGEIPNFINAFFETVSGFTTTGSTILTDIESMGKGTMFWRCFTNWIGGMGVLVFVMFVLPLNEEHSMHILRAEMPGPIIGKLVPKVQNTAKILYLIYSAMTLVIVVLLMLGGMNLYDALVHAFSTAGTGGFSNYANGVAHFDSVYIDYVIGIGLLFFGFAIGCLYLHSI
jgi:trk system potassium uptake protein TrkH